MSSSRRIVLIPSGPLRFSGAVPVRRALVFDARGGGWRLRCDAGSSPPGRPPPPGQRSLPSPLSSGKPASARSLWLPHVKALALGTLGVVLGLVAGALIDRYGPVVGPAGSGSLPGDALRASQAGLAAAADAGAAPHRLAMAHDASPAPRPAAAAATASLPVPAFVLARARREAALPGAPPGSVATVGRRRSPSRRGQAGPQENDEPILNEPPSAKRVPSEPVPSRASIGRGGLDLQ
jgi:hypothetical protein